VFGSYEHVVEMAENLIGIEFMPDEEKLLFLTWRTASGLTPWQIW